jgi:hypothetical protein
MPHNSHYVTQASANDSISKNRAKNHLHENNSLAILILSTRSSFHQAKCTQFFF